MPTDESPDLKQSVQDLILKWLKKRYKSPADNITGLDPTLSRWLFCDVSPHLLSLVAADNSHFFQVYLDLLTHVTESKELTCLTQLKGVEGVAEEMLPYWKALFDNCSCHHVTVSRIFEKAGEASVWQQLYDILIE